MDNVLNKLKTKVSTALPGNSLLREYELLKPIGLAGPGMLWKLFAAKKRSTQQEATVWEFEKKVLDSYTKAQRESIIELFKTGVAILTRIKHPKILSVLQPLEESRESLAFASEPLFDSLKSVLTKGFSNSNDRAFQGSAALKDVEIKYGLMQITEALIFLHSDCHRVHLNVAPEAIVINKFGLWKVAGLEFSQVFEQSQGSVEPSVLVSPWQSRLLPACQPNLLFASPEAIIQNRVTSASDMFSLGLLICLLFNEGRPIFGHENDLNAYKRVIKDVLAVCSTKISNLPGDLKEYVKMMLSSDPNIRPTALQFSRTPYFEDAAMSVLRNVDNMYQLDNLARSQFYKSLPSTIQTLPKSLCLFRVFPQITEDFSNPHMIPFILPAVLQIMEMVTQEEFVHHVLPRLIPVMSMKEPIQIILLLLQNLRILSEKFPISEFRLHVLPLLHSALDTDNRMIQELCLKSIPLISSVMELSVLKNAVLPRVQKLFFRSELLSIRFGCLVCIGKLLDQLDKWIVVDEVLPFLQQIRTRESSVLVAILGIYRIAFSHEKLGIGREHLATKVLPHLIPMSVESGLNLRQYMAFAELIRDMCTRLEMEQRSKLESLHGIPDESSLLGLSASMSNGWTSTNSCANLMDNIIRNYVDASSGLLDSNVTVKQPMKPLDDQSDELFGSATSQPTGLTLEQKRQLAAERSQQDRLKEEPFGGIVQPVRNISLPPKNNTTPRDLTSTLIESNLTAMTVRPQIRPTQHFQSNQSFQSISPSANPTNYLSTPYSGNTFISSTMSVRPSAGFQWGTHGNVNTSPFGCTVNGINPPFASATTPTGQFKPLSKNEIDDLLM